MSDGRPPRRDREVGPIEGWGTTRQRGVNRIATFAYEHPFTASLVASLVGAGIAVRPSGTSVVLALGMALALGAFVLAAYVPKYGFLRRWYERERAWEDDRVRSQSSIESDRSAE